MRDAFLLLHLLLLTYWLGGDLGVFYSSRYVLRPNLSVESRTVALKIMGWLDMAPRISLVLFLPSGISLLASDPLGQHRFGGWRLPLMWLLAAAWLALVFLDHTKSGTPIGKFASRLDLLIRYAVVIGLLSVAAYTLLAHDPFGVNTNPKWIGGKVALYALAIACGIAIRYRLRPFGPAYGSLIASGSSPEVEQALRRSVNGSIPFVATIWVCILGASLLGVVKPGIMNHPPV